MSTLDSRIVNISLPAIMADLQVALTVIEWVPMIYLLTVSSLLLTCGVRAISRADDWRAAAGSWFFSVGALSCGIAFSASWLFPLRALQGGGAAMFMVSFQRAMLVGAAVAVLGIVVAYLRGRDGGRTNGRRGRQIATVLNRGRTIRRKFQICPNNPSAMAHRRAFSRSRMRL